MDDRDLARLLSRRDEPSVLEKEALFDRVLAAMEKPRPRVSGFLLAAGLAAACAAALVLFVGTRHSGEFASRGTGEHGPSVDLICVETGAAGRCRAGGTMAFDVRDSGGDAYLAAFAVLNDEVVWFFPVEGGTGVRIEPYGKPALLAQGIHLTEKMKPGEYEVYIVFSREPLGRDDIKSRLGDDLSGRKGIDVQRQRFVVEPSP